MKVSYIIYLFHISLLCGITPILAQTDTKVDAGSWIFRKYASENQYKIDESLFKPNADHTNILQKVINSNRNVLLPNIKLNINFNGISIPNNSRIYFQPKTIMEMIPNNKGTYAVIKIYNGNNVKLYNPQLRGDRQSHTGNSGEWGMGIDIRSSQNISIVNPKITNMWGDGIYLGLINTSNINKNIIISGGIIDYSRRNGISLTSGFGITIEDIIISNTSGTPPMAGIDVEPNKDSKTITNIKINNVKTVNNSNEGILLYLSNLRYTADGQSNITISGHTDLGSKIGLRVGPISAKRASGIISVSNSSWSKNREIGVKWGDIEGSLVKLNLSNSSTNGIKLQMNNFSRSLKVDKNKLGKNVSFK